MTMLDKIFGVIRSARQFKNEPTGVAWLKDERVLAEQIVLLIAPSDRFYVGDHVHKPKGYRFPGVVRSIFLTDAGDVRLVVQMDNYGLLHIFNEEQLVNDTREGASR